MTFSKWPPNFFVFTCNETHHRNDPWDAQMCIQG